MKKLVLTLLASLLLAAPTYAGTKDIIYASESTTKSLDPHDTSDTYSGSIERAIMQGLMGFDKDLHIVPLLAESYTFNEAATQFTFKLRKGIKFHDGTPFTAEAVKFSIERTQKLGKGAAFIWGDLAAIDIIDDHTVKFIMKQAVPLPLIAASAYASYIVSPSMKDKDTAWFDQGNTLLHNYWYFEAERAFRWCLKLDPDNAKGDAAQASYVQIQATVSAGAPADERGWRPASDSPRRCRRGSVGPWPGRS